MSDTNKPRTIDAKYSILRIPATCSGRTSSPVSIRFTTVVGEMAAQPNCIPNLRIQRRSGGQGLGICGLIPGFWVSPRMMATPDCSLKLYITILTLA